MKIMSNQKTTIVFLSRSIFITDEPLVSPSGDLASFRTLKSEEIGSNFLLKYGLDYDYWKVIVNLDLNIVRSVGEMDITYRHGDWVTKICEVNQNTIISAGKGIANLMISQDYFLDLFLTPGLKIFRYLLALNGKFPEILKDDEDLLVRSCLAKSGKELDTLIKDPEWIVRLSVAKKMYGHDILARDESLSIREFVAYSGTALHISSVDPDWRIRLIVVMNHDYNLDSFVEDPEFVVRAALAKKGHVLDKLVSDSNIYVLREVILHDYRLDLIAKHEDPLIKQWLDEHSKGQLSSLPLTIATPLV